VSLLWDDRKDQKEKRMTHMAILILALIVVGIVATIIVDIHYRRVDKCPFKNPFRKNTITPPENTI